MSSQTPWENMSLGEGQSKDTREKERWGGGDPSWWADCTHAVAMATCADQLLRWIEQQTGGKKMLSKPTCAHTTTQIQFSLINSWIHCFIHWLRVSLSNQNRILFDGQEWLLQQHARYTTLPNNTPQHVVNKSTQAYTHRNRHTYTYTNTHTHTHTDIRSSMIQAALSWKLQA